jgi:hypothetical protein
MWKAGLAVAQQLPGPVPRELAWVQEQDQMVSAQQAPGLQLRFERGTKKKQAQDKRPRNVDNS